MSIYDVRDLHAGHCYLCRYTMYMIYTWTLLPTYAGHCIRVGHYCPYSLDIAVHTCWTLIPIHAAHYGLYTLDIATHTRWTTIPVYAGHCCPYMLDIVVYVIPYIVSHAHVDRRLCYSHHERFLILHVHNIRTYLEIFLVPSIFCTTRSMDGIAYCMRSTAAWTSRLSTAAPAENVVVLPFKNKTLDTFVGKTLCNDPFK